MSQYHINDNTNSFNHTSVGVVNNFTVAHDRAQILEWISPLNPKIRHQDIRTRRVEHVGDWLLETDEYRRWYDGSGSGSSDGESGSAALFCCGGPGVGKTYISSLVIDRLCDQARGQNMAVACFYFDYADRKEQTPSRVLRALLKQIIAGLEVIPEVIKEPFRNQRKVLGGRELSHSETLDMLQTISSAQPTFICLDALDECMVEHQIELLILLGQVLQKSSGTRIFLTGRPHMRTEIEKHLSGSVAVVPIKPNEVDIRKFLDTALKKDPVSDAMDSSLKAEIVQSILERVSETYVAAVAAKRPKPRDPPTRLSRFLLVSLNIKVILRELTIHRRRHKLEAMRSGFGLEDAYGATLEQIKAQDVEKARIGIAALMWISHSERPLRASELCHALAVEVGSRVLHTENILSISTVLNCCQGPIAVDRDASNVRLIHSTLRDYLSTHCDLFSKAHSKMAETCLTYLNLQSIMGLSVSRVPGPEDAPFLEYSSLHWGTHARMELSDRAKALALKILDQYDSHVSSELVLEATSGRAYKRSTSGRNGFTALHCVSFFGLVEVAVFLTEMESWDRDQKDSVSMTPLLWAARYEHEEIVKLLLRHNLAEPDCSDREYGRTALSWAAGNGHEGVVKFFLSREFVNPDYQNHVRVKTPRVVHLLLAKKFVNPDKPDTGCGRTPLSWAARNGHVGVVKLLFGREDVNPDQPERWGRTPLSKAAGNGHEAIVKLLLGRRDVDPNISDNYDRKPLFLAAEKGHEAVMKVLLEREDVDPNKPDTMYGQTPLAWAADEGYEGVVKLLLRREDVDPDKPDIQYGRTPLSWAAGKGHEGVVQHLLDRKDLHPNRPDYNGKTPLSWAAEKGREGVVQLLLRQEDVDPNRQIMGGQTPLAWAADEGYEGVVKLLLRREDVDPDKPDIQYGRTPLSWAAGKGHEGVVQHLLDRKDLHPDRPDYNGKTPLSWAAEKGHEEVVRLLLGREDVVDPDRPDHNGITPLSWLPKMDMREL